MNTNFSNSCSQRGGALLIAMVLIFMMAIMGISTMRGSTLERRMATNSIQTATTFQGAESTTEIALNDTNNMNNAFMAASRSTGEMPVNLRQNIGMVSSATLDYKGQGAAPGFSWGVGGSNFVGLRFEVTGQASIDAVRANATVVQGAYQIAPGNQ